MSLVKVNQDRTWEQMPQFVRNAFRGGQAEKVLLRAGTRLYKFNEYPTLAAGSHAWAEVSPWWTAYDPYRHDPGWEQRKQMAQHFGVSIREYGRVTSAIKENWNSLAYLLVITLKFDTYAFFGGFSQMARIDKHETSLRNAPKVGLPTTGPFRPEGRGRGGPDLPGGENLPGGGTQFYIPNLRVSHIATWRSETLLDK